MAILLLQAGGAASSSDGGAGTPDDQQVASADLPLDLPADLQVKQTACTLAAIQQLILTTDPWLLIGQIAGSRLPC